MVSVGSVHSKLDCSHTGRRALYCVVSERVGGQKRQSWGLGGGGPDRDGVVSRIANTSLGLLSTWSTRCGSRPVAVRTPSMLLGWRINDDIRQLSAPFWSGLPCASQNSKPKQRHISIRGSGQWPLPSEPRTPIFQNPLLTAPLGRDKRRRAPAPRVVWSLPYHTPPPATQTSSSSLMGLWCF